MVQTQVKQAEVGISEEDYLEGELHSDIKHEYIDGEVYAMSGAKAAHNRISGNINRKFGNHLEGQPCEPFSADMKVKIGSKYFYPDVLVDCSDLDDNDLFTESPVILVEVLSRSTRRVDETTKRVAYLQIPTLQEYVLIEQDFVDVEVVRRSEGWQSKHYFLGDDITFESINLTLRVEEIYDRVKNTDMIEWLEMKEQEDEEQSVTSP
jgi:Uma2 family endonuclease